MEHIVAAAGHESDAEGSAGSDGRKPTAHRDNAK
jgi:hypothetical protein